MYNRSYRVKAVQKLFSVVLSAPHQSGVPLLQRVDCAEKLALFIGQLLHDCLEGGFRILCRDERFFAADPFQWLAFVVFLFVFVQGLDPGKMSSFAVGAVVGRTWDSK